VIADIKPYSDYKEARIPWLANLPRHWDVRRLRNVCEMRVSNVDKHTKNGESPVRLCNYVDVYKNERIRESLRFMVASATEDEHLRFRLHKFDVLITKDSEDWHDIGVPSLVEFEAPDLVCGYHLAILRPRTCMLGAFLLRALQCHFIAAQFHVEANGVTRYGLSHGAIRGISVPLPPPDEQAAIVRFLDWANGRLERAIRAKRKVIALLNEQKGAIIHRAVTRGLDAKVGLKSCGSGWFPEVPEQWEVLTLRRVIRAAIDGPHFSPNYLDNGIPFLSARNVKADRWSLDDVKYISESDYREFCRRVRPELGDVLYTKGGTTGVARAVDLTYPFQVWVHIAVLKLKRDLIDPDYLAFALNSPRCYEQSQLFTRGATNQDLGLGRMKDIELPMPKSVVAQRRLVEGLRASFSTQDATIARTECEIELLREYRTRLVADVVTGKLDVRETAARLPEEATPHTPETESDLSDEIESADEEAVV
jgi:type I restriction enzyme S subunit